MSTARFESSTTELKAPHANPQIETPSDEESNVTLVRNRPPSSFAKATNEADDATPLSRLILSKERSQSAARNVLPPRRQTAKGLHVAVLTTETTFANQVRAALEGVNDVTIVATADEAAELAMSKRCPILISDTTPTRGAIESLTTQLRAHDPAVVFIVAGKRDLGGMFIGLQSSGAVDGFLLKPATAASTQLVVESATKRYRAASAKNDVPEPTRRSRTRTVRARGQTNLPAADTAEAAIATLEAPVVPPPSTSQTITPLTTMAPPPAKHAVPRPTWPLLIGAIAAVGAIVWWVMWQRLPDIDPQQVIAQQLALAESAHQDGQLTGARGSAAYHLQTVLTLDPTNVAAQRGLERIATELSRQTQTLMSQQRLADAAAVLERLREMKPDYPELPLLDSQLKQLQDAVLAAHAAPAVSQPIATTPTPVVEAARKPTAQATIEKKQPTLDRSPSGASAGAQERPTPRVTNTAPAKITPPAPNTQQTQAAPAPTPPAQLTTNSAEPIPSPAANIAPATVESAAPSAPQAPTILKYVPPEYPSEAYARKIEGWVQVQLDVTPSGNVVNARIEDGDKRQLFSRAALTAVKQWKYAPRPQATGATSVTVRLDFKLGAR